MAADVWSVWLELMLLLNYKPVLAQPTGIGVYANGVLPAFNQLDHILIPGGGSGGVKERLKRLAWAQFQLPVLAREKKADLIFTPAPEGYLGKQVVPQVVMVHDLRPLSHPERSMQSLYFRNWVPPLLSQCRHIVTNSKFTALEICSTIGVAEEKITVIPLGYDSNHFFPSGVTQRFHDRPYLLHVGQAYPHKNLERLIYAFKSISQLFPEVDLLLLGKPHPSETTRLKRLTSELDLSARVIFKSYVPYHELPNWYRGALVFVYPSLWEGFGLPILEAMACGTPVVTSLGSATEEVCKGDSALLVNPNSVSQIASSIHAIIRQPELATNLRNRGLKNCQNYLWESTAAKTTNALVKLMTRL